MITLSAFATALRNASRLKIQTSSRSAYSGTLLVWMPTYLSSVATTRSTPDSMLTDDPSQVPSTLACLTSTFICSTPFQRTCGTPPGGPGQGSSNRGRCCLLYTSPSPRDG